MAEFLTTKKTASELEKIISDANNFLILISPYFDISYIFLQRLMDADKKNVKMSIVHGKNELNPEEITKLRKLKNYSLWYYKDLHAKCYLNESSMIITSMNLYKYSESNNREMGILIKKDDATDKKIYEDAKKEVDSILNSAEKIGILGGVGGVLKNILGTVLDTASSSFNLGYCIRCSQKIPYDPAKPFCPDCFRSWVEWNNPSHIEKICHSCGKSDKSSMSHPLCRTCFKKS
jgi:hypothetical protein